MSIISSLLEKLFPKSEFRCLTIGLDASGKTTALYQMKLGEVVTTIPTIGFNVETVVVAGTSLTIWDVGGCDKIRPLWWHYYQGTEALIFVVDCNDVERMDEVLKLFVDTITAEELKDATVLILFNKIDIAPRSRLLATKEKVMKHMEPYLRTHVHHTEDVCAKSGDNLYTGYMWLTEALRNRPSTVTPVKAPEPSEKDKLEIQLEEWLTRVDEPDNTFLAKLADYTLDNWDHYTHLRIAFVLLHRHGRREGMKLIFEGIKKFIENSPRTRRGGPGENGENTRGTTFHETMTYFWVHMVHYAIESTKITAAATGLPEFASVATGSGVSPWKRFLLMNPQLANGGLFLHYYSKQRMLMDPDARSMVLLPDKLPLPSLLVDVHQLKKKNDDTHGTDSTHSAVETILPRAPLSDVQFLKLLAKQQLPGWGHEVKLRVIFLLICRWGISGKSKEAILSILRGIEKDGFHYTTNYFWVHQVAYHIVIAIKGPPQGLFTFTVHVAPVFAAFNNPTYQVPVTMTLEAFTTEEPSPVTSENEQQGAEKSAIFQEPETMTDATVDADGDKDYPYCSITFTEFLARPHCQKLRNSLLYSKYYSRTALSSPAATEDLVMPDLKQLPSAV